MRAWSLLSYCQVTLQACIGKLAKDQIDIRIIIAQKFWNLLDQVVGNEGGGEHCQPCSASLGQHGVDRLRDIVKACFDPLEKRFAIRHPNQTRTVSQEQVDGNLRCIVRPLRIGAVLDRIVAGHGMQCP